MGKRWSGKALVVQPGETELRVACLTLGAKPPQLWGRAVLPVPRGAVEDGVLRDVDALGDVLREVRQRPEFQNVRRVVFVLGSTQVLSQTVSVPRMKNLRKLPRLLEVNADLYFPVDVSRYRLTWQVVGQREAGGLPQTQVQLWATPRALLAPYYRLARSCGLTVAAIDYCGRSFAAGIGAAFPDGEGFRATGPVTLHAHLSRSHSLMTFVREGQVLAQRLLHRANRPDADLSELVMELEYFRSEFPACSVDACVVSGSGMEDETFLQSLEALTALPLRRAEERDWCMCLGAGETALDFGDPGLSLNGKGVLLGGSALQWALLTGAALALTAVLGLYLLRAGAWERELQALRTEQLQLQAEAAAVSGYEKNYHDHTALYDDYSADWADLLRTVRTYNDNACLLLQEVENALPGNGAITAVMLREDHMEVDALFPEKEDAAAFLTGLRTLRYGELTAVSDLENWAARASSPLAELLDTVRSQEPAPAEGSLSAAADDSRAAQRSPLTLTQQDLRAGMAGLNAAQLTVLDRYYTELYTTYSLRPLVKLATLTQRKAAIQSLLEDDPLAMHQLRLLLVAELERGGKALPGKTADWEKKREVLTGGDREVLPWLTEALTESRAAVEATEALVKTDQTISRKLAEHLALAMGKEVRLVSAMDFARLYQDILDRRTKETPELDAVVRKLLPAAALEVYDAPAVGTVPETPATQTQPAPGSQAPQPTIPVGGETLLPQTTPAATAGGPKGTAEEPVEGFSLTVTLTYRDALLRANYPRKGMGDLTPLKDPVEVEK